MDALPDVISALVETTCEFFGHDLLSAGAGVGAGIIAKYVLSRHESARDILRSELEKSGIGLKDFKDVEQFAAAALRYQRAARDQAADENLRLLAQAMIGLAKRHELWASEFLKYSEILAPLSRDEIIFIGSLEVSERWWRSVDKTAPVGQDPDANFWASVMESMSERTGLDSNDVQSTGLRACRSGMLRGENLMGGAMGFRLSKLGWEICNYVNLQSATAPRL